MFSRVTGLIVVHKGDEINTRRECSQLYLPWTLHSDVVWIEWSRDWKKVRRYNHLDLLSQRQYIHQYSFSYMYNTLTCMGSFLVVFCVWVSHGSWFYTVTFFFLPQAWHNFQKSFIIATVGKEAVTFLDNVYHHIWLFYIEWANTNDLDDLVEGSLTSHIILTALHHKLC